MGRNHSVFKVFHAYCVSAWSQFIKLGSCFIGNQFAVFIPFKGYPVASRLDYRSSERSVAGIVAGDFGFGGQRDTERIRKVLNRYACVVLASVGICYDDLECACERNRDAVADERDFVLRVMSQVSIRDGVWRLAVPYLVSVYSYPSVLGLFPYPFDIIVPADVFAGYRHVYRFRLGGIDVKSTPRGFSGIWVYCHGDGFESEMVHFSWSDMVASESTGRIPDAADIFALEFDFVQAAIRRCVIKGGKWSHCGYE